MKNLFFVAIAVTFLASAPAGADAMKHDGVKVQHAWARASAGAAKAGAAFMTLVDMGHHGDRLVAAESDLASRTELHTHIMDGGVMKMRQVDGIDVPAGAKAELQPGGFHIMFMGLKKPLVEGETLPLTLIFEKAGRVHVDFTVQGVAAKAAADGHGNHGAGMPGMSHSK